MFSFKKKGYDLYQCGAKYSVQDIGIAELQKVVKQSSGNIMMTTAFLLLKYIVATLLFSLEPSSVISSA